MDEFRLSAYALYPEGKEGDAFAEVDAPTLVACFAQMAGEVADWLAVALARGTQEQPRAVELTLEWTGAPAEEPTSGHPPVPGGPTRRRPGPPPSALRCAARRRLGRVRVGLAAGIGLAGANA